MKTKKRTFSPDFRLEAAQLVVDQGYIVQAPVTPRGSVNPQWSPGVRRLRSERAGNAPKGQVLTPEQREIQELKRKLRQAEEEKEILKKATALLMSDSLNNSR